MFVFPRGLAVAFVATVCLLLAACGGSGSSGGSSGGGSGGGVESTASTGLAYNSHAKAIIDTHCVTCHQNGGQAPFPLTSYSEVQAKKSAMIYALESRSMPLAGFEPLPEGKRQILLDWLQEGARRGGQSQADFVTPYTYYGHVKAIVDDKCANCHRAGDIAPFPLTDYENVAALGAAIVHQVQSGAMPPWPPTNHYLPLRNNRSLSDQDRAVLLSWVEGGAPEGNVAEHEPRPNNVTPVDYKMRLRINEPFTPTKAPDEYRCLMIDWPLDHTVYVDAVNVVPDAIAEVHHVFAVVVAPQNVPLFDAADGSDGKPGFNCLGAPSPEGALVPPQSLVVWAPGKSGGQLPAGTGVKIEPGSKIAMQMHYNTLNTAPVPDQTSLDIHYVDAVDQPAVTLFFLDFRWPGKGGMPIPAGDPNVTVQHTGDLKQAMGFVNAGREGINADEPFLLHSVFMHQHSLGKSASIELLREDGTEVMLVDIRNWDFDWQDEYFFEEPLIVQPGDRLRLTCTWDNSAANQQFINGKQQEPQYTEFGEGTVDEMCVNYFFVTRLRDADVGKQQHIPPSVAFRQPQYLQAFRAGDYVPIELLVNAFALLEPGSAPVGHEHGDAPAAALHERRAGHYHLYLDADDDSAEHLTRWDASTFYQLPADLPPGEHTLRVSLRGDDHTAIGVESRVTIRVLDEVSTAQEPTVQSLIDVAAWQPQAAAGDLFAAHRPAEISCPPNSWYGEDGALEVETGYCDYLSLAQPSTAAIRQGDNIRLVLWHGQLRFEQPEEAHVALSIGGEVIWEDDIEIPNAGGIYDIEVPWPHAVAAGASVQFHLHNHGYNTWTLLSLDVEHINPN